MSRGIGTETPRCLSLYLSKMAGHEPAGQLIPEGGQLQAWITSHGCLLLHALCIDGPPSPGESHQHTSISAPLASLHSWPDTVLSCTKAQAWKGKMLQGCSDCTQEVLYLYSVRGANLSVGAGCLGQTNGTDWPARSAGISVPFRCLTGCYRPCR